MTRSKRFTFNGTEVYLDLNRSGVDFTQRLRALCEAAATPPSRIQLRISGSPRKEVPASADPERQQVEIVLTQAALEHGLLPTRRAYRAFFPGYKVQFALETAIGELTVWVTSNSTGRDVQVGDMEVGQYIQGGLKEWFRAHPELKPGDRVIVTALDAPRRYRLSCAD
jgi:hypothetical protein